MHKKKEYIVVKDRHPRISEVLNDCVKLCVPASKDEPLSSILQKICAKLTAVIDDVAALEDDVEELQNDACPDISEDAGNIIECRDDGIFAEVDTGLRFGVTGEDDTAGEPRIFDLVTNGFSLFGDGGGINLTQIDGSTYNNDIGITPLSIHLQATDVATSISAAVDIAKVGNFQVVCADPANTYTTQFDISPNLFQVNVVTGVEQHRIQIDPTAFSPKGIFIIADDGLGTVTEIHQFLGGWELKGDSFRIFNSGVTDTYFECSPTTNLYVLGPQTAGTNFAVLGSSGDLVMNATGNIRIANNLPEFADNAAALGGGLVAGELYRTGDFVKIVH